MSKGDIEIRICQQNRKLVSLNEKIKDIESKEGIDGVDRFILNQKIKSREYLLEDIKNLEEMVNVSNKQKITLLPNASLFEYFSGNHNITMSDNDLNSLVNIVFELYERCNNCNLIKESANQCFCRYKQIVS